VDVSSRWLDASIGRVGLAQRFANTATGIAQLADFCRAHQVELVAMDATDGGFEIEVQLK
jgi:transposase